jgi:type II secretory pathway pseudopilin PulG
MQPNDFRPRPPSLDIAPVRGRYVTDLRPRPAAPASQPAAMPQQPLTTPQANQFASPPKTTDRPVTAPTSAPKASRKKLLMIAVIVAVIIIVGLIFALSGKKKTPVATVRATTSETETTAALKPGTIPSTGSAVTDAQNQKRQADIEAIQTQVEAYYVQNGYYPTNADMLSVSWLKNNFPKLDLASLQDPTGTLKQLAASPTAGQYSYQAGLDKTFITCDNIANNCDYYVLTAVLSGGTKYTKAAIW